MRTAALAFASAGILLAASVTWGAPDRKALLDGMTVADYRNLEKNLRWILERERSERAREGAGGKARVAVLADAGAWNLGARSVVEALEADGVPCRVLDVSRLRSDGLDGVQALVLPGGWAAYQSAGPGPAGWDRIRAFVQGGGHCLGICAGAFLLSGTVAWMGESFPYPLGLFDGTAEGPLAAIAPWPQRAGVRLALTAEGKRRGLGPVAERDVLYYGGPRMLGGTGVETLATYPDGTAALAARRVGKGEVVMIGPHLERPPPAAGGDDSPPPKDAAALLRTLLALGSR